MIVELNSTNFDKFVDDLINIHLKRFKQKVSKEDFKKWLKESKIIMYIKNNRVVGYISYKIVSNNKFTKFLKGYRRALFINKFATINKVGKYLMKFVFNVADRMKIPVLLIPINLDIMEYYSKYGFIAYPYKEKGKIRFVMIRPPKSKLIVKPIIESNLLENEILLEDDNDDSNEDSNDDNDSFDEDSDDEDNENNIGSFDVKTKVFISNIKSNIDSMIKLAENMVITNSSEFLNILSQLYKIRYLFVIFVNNYSQYSDEEISKILKLFNKSLNNIIKEINKLI